MNNKQFLLAIYAMLSGNRRNQVEYLCAQEHNGALTYIHICICIYICMCVCVCMYVL